MVQIVRPKVWTGPDQFGTVRPNDPDVQRASKREITLNFFPDQAPCMSSAYIGAHLLSCASCSFRIGTVSNRGARWSAQDYWSRPVQ